ncbi:MAG TPA: aminotransferase class I/II-fold pyridoxal phosphate-dependent enzyme [Cytophagales bacterium]|nr:aminotransferase class I/II-fold pyridoxal phosphate-dependent enzyme [Cytophagales bacterium]
MNRLDEVLQKKLLQSTEAGTYRQLKYNSKLVDFCSNDYFGLARNEIIKQKTVELLSQIPHPYNGSSGSRLISGHHDFIDSVEEEIALIHQAEAALILNSGYNANMAVLSSIPQKGELILYDELCHSSIKDGMRLSFAERCSFRHNDLKQLERKLSLHLKRCYVVVESVYSMDGDVAPIAELVRLCESYNAVLVVDEAHSTGVFGENGSGLVSSLGLAHKVPIRIHTYGKALGCHGASVVGSAILKEYLINYARQFIYTTALPLSSYVNIFVAYGYVRAHCKHLQQTLFKKVSLFKQCMDVKSAITYESPILGVLYAGNLNVKEKAALLQREGFDVRPILSPTVPIGKERLRICLHTFNEDLDIEKLALLIG